MGKNANLQTCKLANLQTLQMLQMLQTLQRVQQKGGRSVGAIFLLLFGFYSLDDSANLLLTIFDDKVTTPFISGTHFYEEPAK